MKKRNQITQAAVLAVATMSSVGALAETQTVTATVTVDNSIDFTVTGTMDFGTLRAVGYSGAGDCAFVTLAANPATTALTATAGANATAACANTANAAVQAIGGTLARPVFAIAGVPAFSTLDITVPGLVELTAPLAPGSASFFLDDFTAYKISGGGTPGAITIAANAGVIQVNGSGAATFSVGATLYTDDTFTGQNYENNIAYTGDIEVEVNYQ